MEQRLCEAAIKGNLESLHQIIEEDALILDKVAVGCFNGKSPLHVAVASKKTQFVQKLLDLKPELAEVLDSQFRSALHLASATGQLEIVNSLIQARPEMCLARDQDGRNPLHVAAMKGKVKVLEELVRTSPQAARARVEQDETILHLCVKHSKLKPLELLLKTINCHEFVNAKDHGGNTILHLAILDKRFEITKHVLKNNKIAVNAKNGNGHTAMDILFLADFGSDQKDSDAGSDQKDWDHIEDVLRQAKAKRANDLVGGEWLAKKKDALMIVASLIATMAFQAGVSPPGGVWQSDSDGHRAGEAVMAYNYPDSYPFFLRSNTIGFVASLSTILLLISGLSFKNKAFKWILIVIMWLTVTSMAFTYAFSNIVVTPKKDRHALSDTIVIAVIVWCSVMAVLLVVHTVRLITTYIHEERRRIKAIGRILKFEDISGQGGWSRLRMLRALKVKGQPPPLPLTS